MADRTKLDLMKENQRLREALESVADTLVMAGILNDGEDDGQEAALDRHENA